MKYLVNVYNKQRLVKIADLKIKEIISYVLEDELAPRTMGMNIMLVRDPVIRRYHRDFMGIDTPTDCISFPPEDLKEANVLEPACGDKAVLLLAQKVAGSADFEIAHGELVTAAKVGELLEGL